MGRCTCSFFEEGGNGIDTFGNMRFSVLPILLINIMIANGQSYYTIIDDDISSIQAISSVKKVADKYGIKITYAATVSKLRNKELADTLLQYQGEGHQIIDHGWTHSPEVWKEPQWETCKEELDKSSALLDSLSFKNHDFFVYPFGKYSASTQNAIIPKIKEHYRMAFDARGHYCDLSDFNMFYIPRFAVRWHNNMWIVKYWIRKAHDNHAWTVFLNHSGKSRDYKEENLSEIIEYCQSLGMENLTVAQAYDKFGSLKANKPAEDYTLWGEIADVFFLHIVWIICIVFLIALIGFVGLRLWRG